VLKGSRHDVSTLVDLAVVDPVSRSLVLRAGGTSTTHGNTTWIDAARETRSAATDGYSAATDEMIEHFDTALTKFESDVRSGNAPVQVVRKTDAARSGSGSGGGALDWPFILVLLTLITFRRLTRYEGMAA
jgi:rhombotail lipoprotein